MQVSSDPTRQILDACLDAGAPVGIVLCTMMQCILHQYIS